MNPTNDNGEALADSIARRDALEAAIAGPYKSNDERDVCRAALAKSLGIDWSTGWPVDYVLPRRLPRTVARTAKPARFPIILGPQQTWQPAIRERKAGLAKPGKAGVNAPKAPSAEEALQAVLEALLAEVDALWAEIEALHNLLSDR